MCLYRFQVEALSRAKYGSVRHMQRHILTKWKIL